MSICLKLNQSNLHRLKQTAPILKRSEHQELEGESVIEDSLKAIDPEVLANDRGWLYRCRACDLHTRVRTKIPNCRHCGFTQNTKGIL